ncbi:MAG: hypothetical protein ACOYN0_01300, partial [Phycisphaerales bacterium]
MIKHLLLGALVPAIASTIAFGVVWWRGAPAGPGRWMWLFETIAYGAAAFAGLRAVLGAFVGAPISSDQRLPYAFAVAAMGAVLVGASRAGRPAHRGLLPLLVCGGAAVVIGTRVGSVMNWPAWQQAAAALAGAGVSLALFLSFVRVLDRGGARLGLATMLVVTGCAAQVMVLALASLKLGQCAGVLSASLGGAALMSFVRPVASGREALAAFTAVGATVIIFQGTLFGGPAVGEAALYSASIPLGAGLAALVLSGFAKSLPTGGKWLVTLGAAAALPAIA